MIRSRPPAVAGVFVPAGVSRRPYGPPSLAPPPVNRVLVLAQGINIPLCPRPEAGGLCSAEADRKGKRAEEDYTVRPLIRGGALRGLPHCHTPSARIFYRRPRLQNSEKRRTPAAKRFALVRGLSFWGYSSEVSSGISSGVSSASPSSSSRGVRARVTTRLPSSTRMARTPPP